MEERKAKLLEQLQRMKDGAQKSVDHGGEYYIMHARCAVEFAELAIEVIAMFDHEPAKFGEGFMARAMAYTDKRAAMLFDEGWFNSIAIGYGKMALEEMGIMKLRKFEEYMRSVFDLHGAEEAMRVYNRIEKD